MLKTDWISRSSATQRKGRAGRCQPGRVYRLFSAFRHAHLPAHPTPEILRTPLLELCLQTKLLAPPNTPIADFLARVPEPPAFLVTRNAVQSLKTMEALDFWEEVTPLGSHLLELPLEPVLGKVLLHGVLLKCLDPVLSIVSCAAYRDPFQIPSDSQVNCFLVFSCISTLMCYHKLYTVPVFICKGKDAPAFFVSVIRPDTGFDLPDIRPNTGYF
jgi:HrpA-like RNA helicase